MASSSFAKVEVRRTFIHTYEPNPFAEEGEIEIEQLCRKTRTRAKSDFDLDYSSLLSVGSVFKQDLCYSPLMSVGSGSTAGQSDESEPGSPTHTRGVSMFEPDCFAVACREAGGRGDAMTLLPPLAPKLQRARQASCVSTDAADEFGSCHGGTTTPGTTPREEPHSEADQVPLEVDMEAAPSCATPPPDCAPRAEAGAGTAWEEHGSAFYYWLSDEGTPTWGMMAAHGWGWADQEHGGFPVFYTADELELAAKELEAAANTARASTRFKARAKTSGPGKGPGASWHVQAAEARDDEAQSYMGMKEDMWMPLVDDGILTTVMVRNLPNDYTRDMLLKLLDEQGFAGSYDFVYCPVDFHRWAGFGYAFVNMVSPAEAIRIREVLQGFSEWTVPSQKVIDMGWGNPLQGLFACTDRYRNSPVMHEAVPERFKPVIFQDGKRAVFPPPTQRIRNPRWKRGTIKRDDCQQ